MEGKLFCGTSIRIYLTTRCHDPEDYVMYVAIVINTEFRYVADRTINSLYFTVLSCVLVRRM
jgi:hypothetical protein